MKLQGEPARAVPLCVKKNHNKRDDNVACSPTSSDKAIYLCFRAGAALSTFVARWRCRDWDSPTRCFAEYLTHPSQEGKDATAQQLQHRKRGCSVDAAPNTVCSCLHMVFLVDLALASRCGNAPKSALFELAKSWVSYSAN
jgi:hypothetical protein